jgi:hypothetical protein
MMMDRAAGVMRAAARPCPARAAMSCPALPANPLAMEATVKTVRPVRNTHLRDSRSAMRPPNSRAPPDIIRYAVTTHCMSDPSRCRARPMVGRAVFTTEMSRTTRICAASVRARTTQDLRCPSSS